ncbi:MAG TPA: ABC transporter substrate-binding protein, partial [Saprospiraceae bacterium]|nr:ABC transporter substrate-binding protein [Saprospiraceae bacterium]
TLCQTPILPAYNYDPQNLLADIPLTDLLDQNKAKTLAGSNANLKKFTEDFQTARYTTDPTGIIGSGPYRPLIISNEQTVLVRKSDWWGDKVKGNPLLAAYPARLVYRYQKDEGLIENMLRTGDLDVVLTMSPAKFLELKKDSFLAANYNFETRLSFQYNRWLFNVRNPKLADVRVRQALAHVVDYDYLLNTVQQGMGTRIVSPINPSKPYYAKNIVPYDYNIQKAKSLLAEAGWTDTDNDGIVDKDLNGVKTPLSIDVVATTSSPVTAQIASSIEQTARAAGVKINIVPLGLQELSEETRAGRFEAALYGLGQFPGLNDFYQNYHSKSLSPAGDNRGGFANPEFDRLTDEIRGTSDEAKRNELYIQAQQMLHDQVPEVFLYAPEQRYIGSKRFKCVFSSNRPGYYEPLFQLVNPVTPAPGKK